MKKYIAALALALLTACSVTTPPPAHKVWDLSVSVSDTNGTLLPQALVTVDSVQKEANDFGWAYYLLGEGCHILEIHKDGFKSTGNQQFCIDRATRFGIQLERIAPPTPRLEARNQIFYQDGHPWRWKGVTAFGLENRFCKGDDIQPFLGAYAGFNVLRVFYYVEWEGTGWGVPTDECQHNFLNYVADRGWYVELTVLTGTKSEGDAQSMVNHIFSEFNNHTNLMVELVNEPQVYNKPDTSKINVNAGPVLWASGDYDPSSKMRGSYGVAHTPRDNEWPRKAHDLFEYYNGGGPASPSDPAHHFPQVADEPEKPCNPDGNCGRAVATDFEAYFGVASLLGAGGTFHSETGKYGQLPNSQEAACAAAALKALNFYPADGPLGPYSRIDENGATLRTYQVGPYIVRVRPTSGDVLVPY